MNKAKIRKAFLVVILSGTLAWMACSTAWISEAEQIVAALIPAMANLVTLSAMLQGKSVSTADLQTIERAGAQVGTELQLMQSLIQQYEKADAAAQPGVLSQIQAAMNGAQSTLDGLVPALHITDTASQAKIAAVVGVLLSEVESVAAIVPLVSPSASPGMTALAARQVKKQPPLSASEFVHSYNATLTAKTGDSELDRAATGLQIHLHGKLARWVSAGLLK